MFLPYVKGFSVPVSVPGCDRVISTFLFNIFTRARTCFLRGFFLGLKMDNIMKPNG